MGGSKKRALSDFIIIFVILLFAIIVLILAFNFYLKFKNSIVVEETSLARDNTTYTEIQDGIMNNINENNVQTMSESVKYSSTKQIVKCYSIKLIKQKGREKEYILDKDFTANFKIAADDESSLELIFNNSEYVIKDGMFFSDFKEDDENAFTINFYRIGDYLTFTSHNATDLRSIHLYVIDKQGNLYKDIFELEEDNIGMAVDSIQFIGDSIILDATRISHGPSIVYNGEVLTGSDLLKIPTNTALSATYTYTIGNNGNVDFNSPKVTVKTTMQDFLSQNVSH